MDKEKELVYLAIKLLFVKACNSRVELMVNHDNDKSYNQGIVDLSKVFDKAKEGVIQELGLNVLDNKQDKKLDKEHNN